MKVIVTEKRCPTCKTVKAASEFYKKAKNYDGLFWQCKNCESASKKKYDAENKDKHRAYVQANKEKISERNKRYPRRKQADKNASLKGKYGISLDDYDEMLRKQGGVCKICGGDNGGKSLHVDHDHETGKVRGLLCHGCNVSLGFMKDDESIVMKVYRYLIGNR